MARKYDEIKIVVNELCDTRPDSITSKEAEDKWDRIAELWCEALDDYSKGLIDDVTLLKIAEIM